MVAVWAAGAWRPVGSGPVVACGSGATAGWRPQLADCFSRAAAVSRVRDANRKGAAGLLLLGFYIYGLKITWDTRDYWAND